MSSASMDSSFSASLVSSSMANSQHIPGIIRGHLGSIIMVEHGQFERYTPYITVRPDYSERKSRNVIDEEYAAKTRYGGIIAPPTMLQVWSLEPMASAGEEKLIGVTTEPGFSPILTLGSGGILVELINDVISLPVPLTPRQAQRMVEQLRSWPLLQGLRGRAEADVPALLELIVKVSDFAAAHGDALCALDLNPVIVHPRGNGITIVDVLIEPSQ